MPNYLHSREAFLRHHSSASMKSTLGPRHESRTQNLYFTRVPNDVILPSYLRSIIDNEAHLEHLYKESYTMEVCSGKGGPNTVPYISFENIEQSYDKIL